MKYRYLRFPGGKPKAVTFSYDDGCPEDARFSKRLSESGLKCTFNFCSSMNKKFQYSLEEAEELFFSKGHEIAVHGAFHRAEGTLRPVEGIRDVLDCRLDLEKRYKRIIRGMAYPDSGVTKLVSGVSYEHIRSYLKDLDIAYSRTLCGDNNLFLLPDDWYSWMPTAHHNNQKIFEWIDEFLSVDYDNLPTIARGYPILFYIWGHSYEFERNNNWERLDEICDRISGDDDVWYATNIEIYDYVNAYRSLVYSADGLTVYNPTLYELWFTVDKELYKINPGETLTIKE